MPHKNQGMLTYFLWSGTAVLENFRHRFVGVDFTGRTVNVDGRPVRIQIWDTAGQERFHSLIPSYLREARGAIVVYDVTNRDSFYEDNHEDVIIDAQVRRWLSEIKKHRDDEVEIIIVGNKTDCDGREVPLAEALSLYADSGFTVMETSARTGYNVKMLFHTMARKVYEAPSADAPLSESVLLTAEEVPLEHADCLC
ncbi:Ras family protein [Ancylostoma ceylanicum]|uniref:Ras family protein n=1 Tax=Ancylostoma ceylanicum TaxID=53326 RepID=A0A0D6M4I5_9BILA|nr:Ras family protein [Ancylostoma ceylanicum]